MTTNLCSICNGGLYNGNSSTLYNTERNAAITCNHEINPVFPFHGISDRSAFIEISFEAGDGIQNGHWNA